MLSFGGGERTLGTALPYSSEWRMPCLYFYPFPSNFFRFNTGGAGYSNYITAALLVHMLSHNILLHVISVWYMEWNNNTRLHTYSLWLLQSSHFGALNSWEV